MKRFLFAAALLVSVMSVAVHAQKADAAKPEAGDKGAAGDQPAEGKLMKRRLQDESRRSMMERRMGAMGRGRSSIRINPRMMDTNHDMVVSDEEIEAAMPEIEKQVKETQAVLLKAFDKDGDGVLNEAEQTLMQEAAEALNAMRTLMMYDQNGDLLLDDQEIKGISKGLKERAARTNQMALRRFDKNNDGKIDEEEAKSAPGAGAGRFMRDRRARRDRTRETDGDKGGNKE